MARTLALSEEAGVRASWLGHYKKHKNAKLACRRFGISRSTLYKGVKRYVERGPRGLEDLSRAPHNHRVSAVPWQTVDLIVAIRREQPAWSKHKIAVILARDPATASEVAYHMSAIKGFKEMQDGTAKELAGVKALDDCTLEVTLSYPYADFVYHTARPVFSPVPKEAVEQYGSESRTEHPVGTGPFKFVEWVHEQQVVVDKFEGYYGKKAHLDSVVFKVYMDAETAYQDFKAGTLDDVQIPQGQFDILASPQGRHRGNAGEHPRKVSSQRPVS